MHGLFFFCRNRALCTEKILWTWVCMCLSSCWRIILIQTWLWLTIAGSPQSVTAVTQPLSVKCLCSLLWKVSENHIICYGSNKDSPSLKKSQKNGFKSIKTLRAISFNNFFFNIQSLTNELKEYQKYSFGKWLHLKIYTKNLVLKQL